MKTFWNRFILVGTLYVDGAMAIPTQILQNCKGLCVPGHRLQQEPRLPARAAVFHVTRIFWGGRSSPATATLLCRYKAAATGYRGNTSASWRELPRSHSPHHLTAAERAAEAFDTSLNGGLQDTNHRGLQWDKISTSAVSRALWCHLSMASLKLEEIFRNITWSWAILFLPP